MKSVSPKNMLAAVYTSKGNIEIQQVPVPKVGPKELLIKVESCGICATDLKKVFSGSHTPPLIFGHEYAGTIVKTGPQIRNWKTGDRVSAYHHIPCRKCHYCKSKDYAQCEGYKKVGTTAGFKAAGGGFAQYVLVKSWIVKEGLTKIPHHISFDEASFLEPVNTCLKAINKLDIKKNQSVLILGQGTVGLILLQIALQRKARVYVADPLSSRLKKALALGAHKTILISKSNPNHLKKLPSLGVDLSILATAHPSAIQDAMRSTRNGGKILFFSQTQKHQLIPIDVGDICTSDKSIIGSYSADADLNKETSDLIFKKKLKIKPLISHVFALKDAGKAFDLSMHPTDLSLKVMIHPWS
ncbi:MAG: alcohol dehydrogenase catalytic domain-containing protein [Chlamydiota bacterium]|nr:alcohol dehydrogenase catalytic domain-containing protein [Chlamydiota bacterium]